MMKKAIVIPARYASTRLPGKPLLKIGGKPVIQLVYEKACRSRLANRVIIATDDERIRDAAASFGADIVMTEAALPSGTDRVCRALEGTEAGMVVNLQGDEPFIEADMIDMLFAVLEGEDVSMATICSPFDRRSHEYEDPNTVKVVMDRFGFALYFSRYPIPYLRSQGPAPLYKHIGLYGYTRQFLERFVTLPRGILEETESLEQLRALENGYRIKVLVREYGGFGIDTERDLQKAQEMFSIRK
jgi:3-deoxy-manno-octulosonate cytidylyltransferase (CMP-KDO synthetase)